MVEQHQHAESKHPKDSNDACFPEEEEEEAAGYVQEEYVDEESKVEEESFAPANNWVCHQTGDVVCNDGFRQAKTHKFCVLSVSVPRGHTTFIATCQALGLGPVAYQLLLPSKALRLIIISNF